MSELKVRRGLTYAAMIWNINTEAYDYLAAKADEYGYVDLAAVDAELGTGTMPETAESFINMIAEFADTSEAGLSGVSDMGYGINIKKDSNEKAREFLEAANLRVVEILLMSQAAFEATRQGESEVDVVNPATQS